ncbi:hypothetical protein M378DRAFT_17260 [Amanita muscaria Koide BX008]|uniref:Uncharacterized protein n=1 Tax=Amanita muscaria (strain Koide BX008) TaxID=946122 RepID=A0A0C2W537_AMAMK|nr:hypothetical protein M378DRAFT_17260 [Amanita muscaria Koide BX008]
MYLPIPFTLGNRVQSDTTPVLKTRAPYCHHHRSASADSTEYWIWNGPDHHDLEEDEEDAEHDNTGETNSPPGVGNSDPNLLSRPEQNDSFYDAPSFDKQQDDSGSFDEAYSFSSDLPSESSSPLLRQSRRTLDMAYGSSSPSGSDSPLRGLGLFNLTRNDDASRPFDGLGVVRVRSGRQRTEEEGQEDEDELSPTFLRDLEAYFLVKDFCQPIETPMIRVDDSLTPTMEEQPVAPPATPVTPSPTRGSLTSKIKHALRPRGPSAPAATSGLAMTTIPRSLTTSALPTSISTASSTTVSVSTSTSSTTSVSSTSSFIRRTCSAFRSQYSLNALRAEYAAQTGSPGKNAGTSTSSVTRTRSGVCSPNKSEDSKRTGLSSFLQPVDRASQPVPVIGPTRKVSVSVCMGEGVTPVTPVSTTPITPRTGLMGPMTPITPMRSGGKRSLQTHSVRDSKDWKDVRDLSVLGTISSGLKKRERK